MNDKQHADRVRAAAAALDEAVLRCKREIQAAENAMNEAVLAAKQAGLDVSPDRTSPMYGGGSITDSIRDFTGGRVSVRRVVEV